MPNRAWFPRREAIVSFEADLRAGLLGRELLAVRYVGLQYRSPAMHGRRFHSIDFGVELDFAGGATWSMTWDQAGSNEGLLVAPGPVPVSREGDVASWDFTHVWRARFPNGMRHVDTVWTRHNWKLVSGGPHDDAELGDTRTSDYCLTTLILGAEQDVLVVTLGGGDGTDFSRAQFDEVAVFFSAQEARAAGALLPGDAEAITSR